MKYNVYNKTRKTLVALLVAASIGLTSEYSVKANTDTMSVNDMNIVTSVIPEIENLSAFDKKELVDTFLKKDKELQNFHNESIKQTTNLDKLKANLSTVTTQLEALNNDSATNATQIKKLNNSILSINKNIAKTEKTLQQTSSKKLTAQVELTALASQITGKNIFIENAASLNRKNMLTQLNSKKSELAKAITSEVSLTKKIASIEKSITTNTTKLTSLQSKTDERSVKQTTTLTTATDKLQAQLATTQTSLVSAKDKVQTLTSDIEQLLLQYFEYYTLADDTTNTDDTFNQPIKMIYEAMIVKQTSVDLSSYNLSVKEVLAMYYKTLDEHPEIFYTSNSIRYSGNGMLSWENILTDVQIEVQKLEIEEKVDNIISETVTDSMSEFEKVKAIHNHLAAIIRYDRENFKKKTVPDKSHDINGALLDGIAVCDGYAKSLKYILNKVGIDAQLVTGNAGGPHAWNKVKVDGKWYSMDLTWNDLDIESGISYAYFLISDAKIKKDHRWDDAGIPDALSQKYSALSEMRDPSLVDGYYYYSNSNDNIKMYKIADNFSIKEKLNNVRAAESEVYGEWIYFSNYSNGGYLYKMKKDGTELTQLNKVQSANLRISDGVLRYTDTKNKKEEVLPLS